MDTHTLSLFHAKRLFGPGWAGPGGRQERKGKASSETRPETPSRAKGLVLSNSSLRGGSRKVGRSRVPVSFGEERKVPSGLPNPPPSFCLMRARGKFPASWHMLEPLAPFPASRRRRGLSQAAVPTSSCPAAPPRPSQLSGPPASRGFPPSLRACVSAELRETGPSFYPRRPLPLCLLPPSPPAKAEAELVFFHSPGWVMLSARSLESRHERSGRKRL